MALLNILPISALEFTWTGTRGIADLTDLVGPRGQLLQPLYDDACDVGIALYNRNTDKTVTFYLDREDREESDGSGAVTAWHFRSLCRRFEVTVVND